MADQGRGSRPPRQCMPLEHTQGAAGGSARCHVLARPAAPQAAQGRCNCAYKPKDVCAAHWRARAGNARAFVSGLPPPPPPPRSLTSSGMWHPLSACIPAAFHRFQLQCTISDMHAAFEQPDSKFNVTLAGVGGAMCACRVCMRGVHERELMSRNSDKGRLASDRAGDCASWSFREMT